MSSRKYDTCTGCHQPIAESQFYWKSPEKLRRKINLWPGGKSGQQSEKIGIA